MQRSQRILIKLAGARVNKSVFKNSDEVFIIIHLIYKNYYTAKSLYNVYYENRSING